MSRNETQTCCELIEPAIGEAGWSWDAQVTIGPGRVNLTGEAMYDPSQRIVADYLLKLWRMPVAILEAKPEGEPAANGMRHPPEASCLWIPARSAMSSACLPGQIAHHVRAGASQSQHT